MRRLAPASVLAVIALAVAAPAATAATATPQPELFGVPAVDPGQPNVVYQPGVFDLARPRSGLWRSDDAGATYRPLLLGGPISRLATGQTAVAVVPGAVLAADVDGALRRSTDGGVSFTAAGRRLDATALAIGPPPSLTAFAVVSRDESGVETPARRVSAASRPPGFECTAQVGGRRGREGLWRLAGGAWRHVVADDVRQVVPQPGDPAHVYARSLCSVYRSDDGGATFRRVVAGTPNALVVHPLDPDSLLAATPATLLASDDGGATWRRVPGVQPAAVAQLVVAAPERVVVIDERQIDRQRVLVSDDFGATWRTAATLGDTAVGLLLPAPSDPSRLYALTGTSLLTSADGGASWSAHGQPLDGRGPVIRLAAAEARLVPMAGGRERPGFILPLALDAAERGGAFTDARLVVRRAGRARTIGIGSVRFGARHAANLRIELRLGVDGMVRNAGALPALLRLESVDDVGAVAIRWEQLTLVADNPPE